MAEPLDTELTLAPRGDDIRVPPVAPSLAEDAAPNPVELILDRLHGRWLWVAFTGVVLAPLLAAAAYFLTPVIYTAQGIIGIEQQGDITTFQTAENSGMSNFAGYVVEQTMMLKSDRLIAQAAEDARLAPFAKGAPGELSSAIAAGLSAIPAKGTGFISVQVESSDASFAAAAVNCVMDAYLKTTGSKESHASKVKANRDGRDDARRRIDDANAGLLALLNSSQYGTASLAPIIADRVQGMQRREAEIASIDAAMKRIREARPAGEGEPPRDARLEPSSVELNQVNPNIAAVQREIDQTKMQLELAIKSYSQKHPIYQNVQKRFDLLTAQLGTQIQTAREAWVAGAGRMMAYGDLLDAQKTAIGAKDALKGEIALLNKMTSDAESLKRKLAQEEDEERSYAERLKELQAEAATIEKGRASIRTVAVPPGIPSKDRRKQLAIAGGVGGFVMSFAIFFLWGTLDKRTFGTRQLAGTNPAKLLCAGAIPDMDALENDPETKHLASNCVHRIRTRIESRRTPGDGYALMVSSPFQGDGKTTLAVALAWSYAESGYRTLIVDCDFIGQALSFQFGQLGASGVREALQGADPLAMIAPAGATSLWILPVGRDRHFGASRVHPTGLRRLFRELRNRYDIIIVDTGPMTASIEALPVASSVDGVVLSLRRGRSRQRLDECIADIGSVGAEYLGVVLNYADRKDCMRYGSVSRMSADITRALEGKQMQPTKHALLAAISGDGQLGSQSHVATKGQRREGDAA
ncbi:MAG: hypothetical protein SGJ09_13455 [Phycisphaerae bacterium]|nr:hypothetical protein [Phycisphaerae bacterium]